MVAVIKKDILSRLLFCKLHVLLFLYTRNNTQEQDSGDVEKHKKHLKI